MVQQSTFGERLAEAREAAGLSQEELGRGMKPDGGDLGKGAVSAWETDRSQPTAEQLRRICQRLSVGPAALLGLKAA